MDNRTQLFRLNSEAARLLRSMPVEDFHETIDALIECDLYRLPYDMIDLQYMPIDRETGPDTGLNHVILRDVKLILGSGRGNAGPGTIPPCKFRDAELYDKKGNLLEIRTYTNTWDEEVENFITQIVCGLIVLLTTKGVDKQVQHFPKKARRDTHISHRHSMVTTITGAAREYTASTGEGTSPRTHMRRGHVRRQHYGPQNSLIKKVFIEPCVVNADQGEWHEREAYNVSMSA